MARYLRPSKLEVFHLFGLDEATFDFGERKRAKKHTFDASIPSFFGIYGYNGSGKSALLTSLRILHSFFYDKANFSSYSNYIFEGEKEAKICLDTLLLEEEVPLGFLRYELTIFKEKKKNIAGYERLSYSSYDGNKKELLCPKSPIYEGKRSKLTKIDEEKATLFVDVLANHISFYPDDSSSFASLLEKGEKVKKEELLPYLPRLTAALEAMSLLLAVPYQVISEIKDDSLLLLLHKGEENLPYQQESKGIRKLLSLFMSVSSYLSSPLEWVILDEVDSGIFEYLYGEMMRALYERGKGSLLFTSHNLRTLETLPHHHARFASLLVKGRFFEIPLKEDENLRDVYLRSLALRKKYPGEDIPSFMRKIKKAGRENS